MRKLISIMMLLGLVAAASAADSQGHFKMADVRMIFVPAFRTYFADEYRPSERNIALLKALSGKIQPVQVKFSVSDPDAISRLCRGSYPIYAPGKVPYEAFVADAMKRELNEAGLYSETSSVVVTMSAAIVDFESFGTGKWRIEAMFSTPEGNDFSIKHESEFPVSFEAGAACGQVARALAGAMEGFLRSFYANESFANVYKAGAKTSSQEQSGVQP